MIALAGAPQPRIKPNIAADLDQTLDPGTYRFVLLPQPVDARALVLLERKPEPLTFSGHGPHALPLDKKVENVWLEPEGPEGLIEDAPRPPDVWRFELPAKAHTAIELTEEMQGHLAKDGTEVAFVPPGRGWKGELETGVYQLYRRGLAAQQPCALSGGGAHRRAGDRARTDDPGAGLGLGVRGEGRPGGAVLHRAGRRAGGPV